MASNIYFGRDTRVFLVQGANTWEIPVLNGFSYTQGSNTSEVTLAEMTNAQGDSRRGRAMFTDSQAPAEWSFDTYVRPTLSGGKHHAVEEALWANFVADNAYDSGSWVANTVNAVAGTSLDIKFTNSNKSELGTFDLLFVIGGNSAATSFSVDEAGQTPTAGRAYGVKMYRMYDATINEVGITFDIDGIATLGWSGNASRLRDYATDFSVVNAIRLGVDQTNNFIRNRLTQLTAIRKLPNNGGTKQYNITLTGGTITLTNNLTYLTPELLGRVNVPLGHVTGTRTIGGSFTCYLDASASGSSDLFEDLSEDLMSNKNEFDLTFYVGGGTGTVDVPRAPGMVFSIPHAHITVPAHDTSDVVALSVDFSALPTDLNTPDEIDLIRYVGVA